MEEVGFTPVQEQETPKQRPTFLTVLCILSWISAVWTVVSSSIALSSKDDSLEKLEDEISNINEAANVEEMPSFFQSFMDSSLVTIQDSINNFMLINSSNLVLYLAQIFAVYLMFNLNKKGFWLYTFVQVALLIFPFSYMTLNTVFIITVLFAGLLTLAFIIMYATNLKHMK
ncbi:MAG: hypothetical protein ACLGGV_04200 [Bacteroidia bacterium]